VVAQVLLLLIIDEAFLLLGTFVLFDDTEERVALEFSLLAEHFFALHELSLAGNVESFCLSAFLLSLCNFLGTFIALVLFKSTFLPQGINLSLTISGALLKIAEPFYFKLLLFLEFLLLGHLSFNGSTLLRLVLDNLHVFILLSLHFIGFPIERDAVSLQDLMDHFFVTLLLLFGNFLVNHFHLFNVLKHLCLFLFKELALLDTLLLALGNLIDDDLSTCLSGTCTAVITLLLLLERLQALKLHH